MAVHALVGPYRAGKTSIGRELALSEDRPMVDTDGLIRHVAGICPSTIKGPDALSRFRELHESIMPEWLPQIDSDAIVSTGYLLPMFQGATKSLLAKASSVIYLRPDIEALDRRWNKNSAEPRIPTAIIQAVFDKYDPYYQRIATDVVPLTAADNEPEKTAQYIAGIIDA